MKKRNFITSLLLIILACFSIFFSGCESSDEEDIIDDKTYTILYSDGSNTHTLEVKYGDVYSIPKPLPSKEGMEFLGLYDAESGGTQYVSSLGVSVSSFSDRKNIVLYPQFKDKEYTLKFDYGEAESVVPSVKATHNGNIPMLPSYLTVPDKEYKVFTGWYVQIHGIERKISGSDGVPIYSSMKELLNLFYQVDETITLYVKFGLQNYTVTFYSADGKSKLKTVSAEYGSNLSKISSGISYNGRTVLTWSSSTGGAEYTESITRDISLYALTYATLTVPFSVNNCKNDNGYNPVQQAGEEDDRARHNGYEIVRLAVKNTERLPNGTYHLTNGQSPTLSLTVMQNLGRLPINSEGSTSIKEICSDSFAGSVYGTNIDKQQIGYGAYYAKVTYTDGSATEKKATDILNGKTYGSGVNIEFPFNEGKNIKTIEVVVVYEIHSCGYAVGWWNEYTNWRCSTKLLFN